MADVTAPRVDEGAHDAIVVGARVAGSATAHMLAGMGWRVALVERKRRPLGPTLSLLITQPRGLARFRDLGLFPAIERIMPQFGRHGAYQPLWPIAPEWF